HESGEQRMGPERLGLELGVELDRQIPRVARQLDDLDELAVERAADDTETGIGERFFVRAVELVAMPVTLVGDILAVEPEGEGVWCQAACVAPEPHGPAQVVHAEQIPKLVDDLV